MSIKFNPLNSHEGHLISASEDVFYVIKSTQGRVDFVYNLQGRIKNNRNWKQLSPFWWRDSLRVIHVWLHRVFQASEPRKIYYSFDFSWMKEHTYMYIHN